MLLKILSYLRVTSEVWPVRLLSHTSKTKINFVQESEKLKCRLQETAHWKQGKSPSGKPPTHLSVIFSLLHTFCLPLQSSNQSVHTIVGRSAKYVTVLFRGRSCRLINTFPPGNLVRIECGLTWPSSAIPSKPWHCTSNQATTTSFHNVSS